MRMASVMVFVAACGSSPASPPDAGFADASVDAPCIYTGYQPISVTGTSPNGALDSYDLVRAGYAGAGCTLGYGLAFSRHADNPVCTGDANLMFAIYEPFDSASIPTQVTESTPTYVTTFDVTFEVEELGAPPYGRIAGHLVSHDPAWTFDIAIDVTSQSETACL